MSSPLPFATSGMTLFSVRAMFASSLKVMMTMESFTAGQDKRTMLKFKIESPEHSAPGLLSCSVILAWQGSAAAGFVVVAGPVPVSVAAPGSPLQQDLDSALHTECLEDSGRCQTPPRPS